jgi:hypothetical protein
MKEYFKDRASKSTDTWLYYLILPLVYGLLTTVYTGFYYGVSNNVFHIPYVLDLEHTPEFIDDPYYATLKNMTSIIWPIIRMFSVESNIESVFYIAFVVSTVMAYAGIIYIIRSVEYRLFPEILLVLTVLMLSPYLRDASIIGHCGMFLDFFNHSEVSWMFIFLSIGFLSLDKVVPSYAMIGIAFSINAFIGIWLLFINTLTLILIRKKITYSKALKAFVAFAVFAFPVVIWIYTAISGKAEVVQFKFIDYIRQYYPEHFLFEAASWDGFVMHIMMVSSGILAARHMPNRRFWIVIQLVTAMIILIGIPLPYIFDNRFVFNLHLIRSAGVGQAIAAVLITIAGVRLFLDDSDQAKRNIGIVILLSMMLLDIKMLGMAILLLSMIVSDFWVAQHADEHKNDLYNKVAKYRDKLVMACVVLLTVALIKNLLQNPFNTTQQLKSLLAVMVMGLMLFNNIRNHSVGIYVVTVVVVYALSLSVITVIDRAKLKQSTDEMPQNRSWNELVSWVKTSSLHGPFLLPSNDRDHTDYFQLQARKKVWVDWKQGAAVMWSPSFYEQWSTRNREVSELRTNEEYISYAKEHGIKYVVLSTTDGVCPLPAKIIKKTSYYILCGID